MPVSGLLSRYGLAPIAASTHPFTPWRTQHHSDKRRYNAIAADLKGIGRRMVIGGMHVHVGIVDDEQRISVMNQIRSFLPLLLALSTSSPFWQGENTGLKIEDATKIWWDLRPSARFPTLELRITDICPLIDDALCIAALFRCLCRCLHWRNGEGLRLPNDRLLRYGPPGSSQT